MMTPLEQRKHKNKQASELIVRKIEEHNYPQIVENFQRKFNDFMRQLIELLTE